MARGENLNPTIQTPLWHYEAEYAAEGGTFTFEITPQENTILQFEYGAVLGTGLAANRNLLWHIHIGGALYQAFGQIGITLLTMSGISVMLNSQIAAAGNSGLTPTRLYAPFSLRIQVAALAADERVFIRYFAFVLGNPLPPTKSFSGGSLQQQNFDGIFFPFEKRPIK